MIKQPESAESGLDNAHIIVKQLNSNEVDSFSLRQSPDPFNKQ